MCLMVTIILCYAMIGIDMLYENNKDVSNMTCPWQADMFVNEIDFYDNTFVISLCEDDQFKNIYRVSVASLTNEEYISLKNAIYDKTTVQVFRSCAVLVFGITYDTNIFSFEPMPVEQFNSTENFVFNVIFIILVSILVILFSKSCTAVNTTKTSIYDIEQQNYSTLPMLMEREEFIETNAAINESMNQPPSPHLHPIQSYLYPPQYPCGVYYPQTPTNNSYSSGQYLWSQEEFHERQ
jgi:hypothetical protein